MAASAFRKIDGEIYQEQNWRNCKITRYVTASLEQSSEKQSFLLIFIGKYSTFHEILLLKSVTFTRWTYLKDTTYIFTTLM